MRRTLTAFCEKRRVTLLSLTRLAEAHLNELHFVADREAYEFASALMAEFGATALTEAATRAERSRDLGNFIHYARWCRAGRAIQLLADPQPRGALH
jgi:hypothetical protein